MVFGDITSGCWCYASPSQLGDLQLQSYTHEFYCATTVGHSFAFASLIRLRPEYSTSLSLLMAATTTLDAAYVRIAELNALLARLFPGNHRVIVSTPYSSLCLWSFSLTACGRYQATLWKSQLLDN